MNRAGSDAGVIAETLGPRRRAVRWAELIGCFGGVPVLLFFFQPRGWLIPLIIAGGIAATIALRADPTFDRRQFTNLAGARRAAGFSLMLFVCGAAVLAAFTWLVLPHKLFEFPRERPMVWAIVMVLYPLLSALPQEIIFRTFMFHRYAPILPPAGRIVASAVAFGWAHVFLSNWIAVVFSLLGGVIFAWSYQRSRSTVLVWAEHALYGGFAFTIGLGAYFYHAGVR